MDKYDWECPEMKRLKMRMSDPDIAWAVGILDWSKSELERTKLRAKADVKKAQSEMLKFRSLLMQLSSMIGDEVWED